GEKYGEKVRVVEIDPKFSVELCGGTHVENTKEIGYFKFRSEGSVASGTRRIEAVTGAYALELLKVQERDLAERIHYATAQAEDLLRLSGETGTGEETRGQLEQALRTLEKIKKTGAGLSPQPRTMFKEQETRRMAVDTIVLELAETRRRLEKILSRSRLQSLSTTIDTLVKEGLSVNGFKLVSAEVDVDSMEELKTLGDTLRSKIGSGVGLLASVMQQKVALVCIVTDDLVASRKLEAGKIVSAVAKLLGGGGGGRAHMATAGGNNVAGLQEALKSAETIIRSFLKNETRQA
ncbi:MAG: hypothetical protein HYW57_06070, partial [Ignavibacteriales bacterium]|nr:hypothetical protein [Ignavibacteriales bacterium]